MVKAFNLEEMIKTLPESLEEAKKRGEKNYKANWCCEQGHLPIRTVTNNQCFLCKREKTRITAEKRRRRLGSKVQKGTEPLQQGLQFANLTATGKLERQTGLNGKKGVRTHAYHQVKCQCGKEFWLKAGMWGVTERCRTCANSYSGEKNKTHDLTGTLIFQIFHSAKKRAKRTNLEFSLIIDDIEVPELCPILGIELDNTVRNSNDRSPRYNAPSLDRLDPTVGYTKENVMIMSHRANVIKNDGTSEEHILIAEFLDEWQIKNGQ